MASPAASPPVSLSAPAAAAAEVAAGAAEASRAQDALSCPQCSRSFKRKAQLTSHLRSHAKPFVCATCDARFGKKSHLTRHEFLHTNEKPFKCGICQKAWARMSDLKVHLRIHSGQRPYSCPVCCRDFVTSSHLRAHERTHTQAVRFSCGTCQKRYRTRPGVNLHHKKTGHEGVVALEEPELLATSLVDSVGDMDWTDDVSSAVAFLNSEDQLAAAVDAARADTNENQQGTDAQTEAAPVGADETMSVASAVSSTSAAHRSGASAHSPQGSDTGHMTVPTAAGYDQPAVPTTSASTVSPLAPRMAADGSPCISFKMLVVLFPQVARQLVDAGLVPPVAANFVAAHSAPTMLPTFDLPDHLLSSLTGSSVPQSQASGLEAMTSDMSAAMPVSSAAPLSSTAGHNVPVVPTEGGAVDLNTLLNTLSQNAMQFGVDPQHFKAVGMAGQSNTTMPITASVQQELDRLLDA